MISKIKKYGFIILVLSISLLLSEFSIKNIFLASSPKLNPLFAHNTINKIKNVGSSVSGRLASIQINLSLFNSRETKIKNSEEIKTKIAEIITRPTNKLTKGVYADENNIVVVANEVDYMEYLFIIKGKEVKIKVPKGMTKPTQEDVEGYYE